MDFALRSKLWPSNLEEHCLRNFSLSWNKGKLRPTPFCHIYSEPSGHEESPGADFYAIPI